MTAIGNLLVILEAFLQALAWRHLLDAQTERQMDIRCIIYPSLTTESLTRVILSKREPRCSQPPLGGLTKQMLVLLSYYLMIRE
jgi:hypothetical protein